jgi:hypothetical protein
MTSQFIHIDGWPRVSRDAPHQTARGMIEELTREVKASQHIEIDHVWGARLAFGDDPYRLLELAEQQAEMSVDRRGFTIKKTSNIIFIAVASLALTRDERLADDGWEEAYLAWRERVIAFSRSRWRGLKIAIMEHVDEDKLHLHIAIVPRLRANRQLDVGAVHPGFGAVERVLDRQSRDRGSVETTPREIKKRQKRAYCHAMRGFQDDFHREVGAASGQARLSNSPRTRIAREQALISQSQRQRHIDLNFQEREILVDQFDLQRREAALAANEARLQRENEQMVAERLALREERQRLEVTKAQSDALRFARPVQIPSGIGQREPASTRWQHPPLHSTAASATASDYEIEEFPTPARFSSRVHAGKVQPLVGTPTPVPRQPQPGPIADQSYSDPIEPIHDGDDPSPRMAA